MSWRGRVWDTRCGTTTSLRTQYPFADRRRIVGCAVLRPGGSRILVGYGNKVWVATNTLAWVPTMVFSEDENVRIGYGRPSGSLKSGQFLSHTLRDSPALSPTPASASDTASPPDRSPTADSASPTASPPKKRRKKLLPAKAEVSDSPEFPSRRDLPCGTVRLLGAGSAGRAEEVVNDGGLLRGRCHSQAPLRSCHANSSFDPERRASLTSSPPPEHTTHRPHPRHP